MFYTAAKHGPKGHQTGYVVKNADTEVVATFRNKDHGYWRFAKMAAERECDRLNREIGEG